MAKFYNSLNDDLKQWITQQHVFFVATAPLSGEGHVNLSPKGYDSLRILDAHTVAYLDMTGSGSETSAHIMENKRITFMWCAFEGPPNILRAQPGPRRHQLHPRRHPQRALARLG